MTKRTLPIDLHFPVAVEYSTDGGTTWISIAANERKSISQVGETPVKVRTAELIETLTHECIGVRKRQYKSVNIKNMKTITTARELFYYGVVDHIRLGNTPVLSDMYKLARDSVGKTFSISELPEATNIEQLLYNAKIKKVGNLVFGKAGALVPTMRYLYGYLRANIVGDIIMKGDRAATAGYMFTYSDIDMFPFIDLRISENADGDSSNYKNSGIFNNIRSKYILEGNVRGVQGSGGVDRKYYISYDNQGAVYGMFYGSHLHFSGLSLMCHGHSGVSSAAYTFSQSGNLKAPFKFFNSNGQEFCTNNTSPFDGTMIEAKIGAKKDQLAVDNGYAEVENWMEEVEELEVLTSAPTIGATSLLVKDTQLEIVTGSQSVKLDDANRYSEDYTQPYLNQYTGQQVYGSRNGYRAYKDGTSVDIKDHNGALLSSLTNVDNIVGGNFSDDGSMLYLVTATKYDVATGGTQQLTGSVKVYNSTTGQLLEEVTVSLLENQELRGVWRPNINSNWQFMKTLYVDDGAGTMVETTSSVESVYNNITRKTINLSVVAHLVGPNYYEDNEFVCVNNILGKAIRCFGK